MFNVTGSELIFLLLAGLMVLGPDRLPGVMRRAGRLYGELRRMANGYEREFRDTFAEPITEFRKAANEIRTEFNREVAEFGKVDPEPSPPMRPEQAGTPQPVTDSSSDTSPDTVSDPVPGTVPTDSSGDRAAQDGPEQKGDGS